jgi:antitoxin ParD1/3/4
MSRHTSIRLGDYFADFVDEQVKQGHYASASDVVRAGLRLLEEREASLQALRAALIEGEKSGGSTPFDFEGFIVEAETRRSGQMSRFFLSPRANADLISVGSGTTPRKYGISIKAERHMRRIADTVTLIGESPALRRFFMVSRSCCSRAPTHASRRDP